MSPRILTIVPSRKRPELLLEMVGSYIATKSPGNSMVIYISPDDPRYEDYLKIHLPPDCTLIWGPRQYITTTYNQMTKDFPNYDYYAPLNDDHFCVTPEWDLKLIALLNEKSNGWGCAMAEDKLTDWAKHPHPSGCIISRKTIDALGYMCYPKLHHIGNDVIMGKLFGSMGLLHGTKDVVIEHRHWVNGMRSFDDNYRWIYGKEEQSYGDATVVEYLHTQYEIDKKKIADAMAAEQR